MKRLLDRVVPPAVRLPLLFALLWNLSAYYGGRLAAQGRLHHLVAFPLDDVIPFLPWTVSIYLLSYLFWAVNYLLAARRGRDFADRYFFADFLVRCVCFLFFTLLPTTNLRPEVTGGGLWNGLMRLLYQMDAADNLFPSIHCAASMLCVLAVAGDQKAPLWYRGFSGVFAAAVFVSTMTTKQHVLVDVLGGILLALLCYWLAGRLRMLSRGYGDLLRRLGTRLHIE